MLARIKINGEWLSEESEVREGIARACQTLLIDKLDRRAAIDGLPFSTMSLDKARSLELPLKEGEVFIALNEMEGDKAPELDGLTLAFWQESW